MFLDTSLEGKWRLHKAVKNTRYCENENCIFKNSKQTHVSRKELDASVVLWSKNWAGTQQWRPLYTRIRNLNFILKALGGFLTSCQKVVYFSNVLKYIPDQPRAPKERNHMHAEDPTRKLMEPCILPVLQVVNTIH